MKFKKVSQDYIDKLKPNDDVFVFTHPWPASLYSNGDKVRKGTFVGTTPTGKLSIKLANGKMWLNGDGLRTQTSSPYLYVDFTLVEKVESEA